MSSGFLFAKKLIGEVITMNGQNHVGSNLQDNQRELVGKERTLTETMAITTERLFEIENKLNSINVMLFGPEPCDSCNASPSRDYNARSLAGSAFSTSITISHMCDALLNRIGNQETTALKGGY